MKQLIAKLAIVAALTAHSATSFMSDGEAATFLTCNKFGPNWQNVSGEWVASVGPVVLSVNGQHVTGIYNKDTWSLDLRYSDSRKHLYGRWSHRNGLEGPVIFQLDQAGCINHARWGGTGSAVCDEKDSSACIHDWAFHGRAKK